MRGIAFRRHGELTNFHQGSALFQLQPSLGLDPGFNDHVVVAVTPRAVCHGKPETTAFYCTPQGDLKPYGGWERAEVLTQRERIVGRMDVSAALANLRYIEMPVEREAELQHIGMAAAKAWASSHGILDPQDYAGNNWGLFAARHLAEQEGVKLSSTEHNTVDWDDCSASREYNHPRLDLMMMGRGPGKAAGVQAS